MTRINTIDACDLTNEWLLAEYRELPRIVNELRKHPNRFDLKKIPKNYTLNKGHVMFFRDKLLYLKKRHDQLRQELTVRGIKYDNISPVVLDDLAPHIKMFGMKDWCPTSSDHKVLIERLNERFSLRKKAYHKTNKDVKQVINCEDSYEGYSKGSLNKYL